jgi:S-DNA-T family DNA segregation ATPase FtsK/SpoIIIE
VSRQELELTSEPLETDWLEEPEPEQTEVVDADSEVHAVRDTLSGAILRTASGQRRPIVPAWLTNRGEFVRTLKLYWGSGFFIFAFHALRLHVYSMKALLYSPRGLWKVLSGIGRWWHFQESAGLRMEAAVKNDPKVYLSLMRERNEHVRMRGYVILGCLLVGLPLSVFLWAKADEKTHAAFIALAILGLAKLGAPADKPIMQHAVLDASAPRMTSAIIVQGLTSPGMPAGIAQGHKSGASPIQFVAPIQPEGGLGWTAQIDLPHGVTASEVQDKREALASGLRRPLGCVWPETDPKAHPGRLVLFVSRTPLAEMDPPTWPLMKQGNVSLFKPIPFGFDQRGRKIELTLMFSNVLIGAMPRFGKTYALRLLALAASLDPTSELRVWELKGTGDLSALEPIAHRYGSGPDDETLERLMDDLRDVYKELERRAEALRKLPRGLVPEFKVTPDLASRRHLGLYPLLVIVDEIQELFSHPSYRSTSSSPGEAELLFQAILKRGPALGVIVIVATQRPDARSLPTGVSSNALIRYCLKVMGHVENDMILGSGMSKAGYKAQLLSPEEKGVGYLGGVFEKPVVARTYKLDGSLPERIVKRALALREEAGTLSGHAIGEEAGEPEARVTVLVDVLGVWPADRAKASSEWIANELSGRLAGRYLDWKGADLTRALTVRGVEKKQVWVDEGEGGRNAKGFWREDIEGALRVQEELSSPDAHAALEGRKEAQ